MKTITLKLKVGKTGPYSLCIVIPKKARKLLGIKFGDFLKLTIQKVSK